MLCICIFLLILCFCPKMLGSASFLSLTLPQMEKFQGPYWFAPPSLIRFCGVKPGFRHEVLTRLAKWFY